MLSRRKAAAKMLSIFAVAGVLAACASSPIGPIPPPTPAQGQQEVLTLAAAFSTLIKLIETTAPAGSIPAGVIAQAQTLINQLNQYAGQIGAALVPDPTSTVQSIGNIVSVLATLLTPFFPAASIVGGIIKAGLALMPQILALFGVAGASKNFSAADASKALFTLQAAATAK